MFADVKNDPVYSNSSGER